MGIKGLIYRSRLSKAWHKYTLPIRVWRTVNGFKCYMNLRDHIDEFLSDLENREPEVLEIARSTEGFVWDIGANIGVFALNCKGRVLAVDASPTNIQLLVATTDVNKIPPYKLTVWERAFTSTERKYIPPENGRSSNTVDYGGYRRSTTYRDLDRFFGIPELIKIDIEGGEVEVMQNLGFKQFVLTNNIKVLVEIHDKDAHYWSDVKQKQITSRHVLYNSED